MNKLNYERDMLIDQSGLDVELLQQASLALKYGKHHAQLKLQVDKLQERKKTLRSELIQEANRDPEKCCSKTKPNASDIEAYYRAHSDYQELIEELLQTEYELQYAGIAKWEIAVTRKEALQYLVKLHGQQYFAGPSIPRDLDEEWKRKVMQEEVDNATSRKMSRGKGAGKK